MNWVINYDNESILLVSSICPDVDIQKIYEAWVSTTIGPKPLYHGDLPPTKKDEAKYYREREAWFKKMSQLAIPDFEAFLKREGFQVLSYKQIELKGYGNGRGTDVQTD